MKKILYLLVCMLAVGSLQAQIPNASFENWETTNIYSPNTWNFLLGDITRESGAGNATQGTYGAKITAFGGQGDMPGVLGIGRTYRGQDWAGGTPYAAKPDSLLLDVKYELPVGTEAMVLVKFKKNGTFVKEKQHVWTGVRTSSFETVRFGFDWQGGDQTPDSVIIMISNMNFEDQTQSNSGWLLVDNVRFKNVSGNPPALSNGSFETWNNRSFLSPTGWESEDQYMAFLNDYPSVAQRDASARLGSYAIKLQNYVQPGGDTVAARLETKSPHPSNNSDNPSFPVTAKHTTLFGWYKFTKVSTDTANVYLTMYNAGQNIGDGYWETGQTSVNWVPFSVNVNYWSQNGPNPDSADIEINAYKRPDNSQGEYPSAMGNSILWIDGLSFDALMTSSRMPTPVAQMTLGPNPAATQATLQFQLDEPATIGLRIVDIQGNTVYSIPTAQYVAGATSLQLPVSQLSSGAYFVVLSNENWYRAEKLQVVH